MNSALDDIVKNKMLEIAANRERLVEAWIAETGLSPSQSVLVQNPLSYSFSVEPKGEFCKTHGHEISELKSRIAILEGRVEKLKAALDYYADNDPERGPCVVARQALEDDNEAAKS